MRLDDSHTIAVAVSYAIAAIERLPLEWRDMDELCAMRDLFKRIIADEQLQTQFLEVSRETLAGRGRLFKRPKPPT